MNFKLEVFSNNDLVSRYDEMADLLDEVSRMLRQRGRRRLPTRPQTNYTPVVLPNGFHHGTFLINLVDLK